MTAQLTSQAMRPKAPRIETSRITAASAWGKFRPELAHDRIKSAGEDQGNDHRHQHEPELDDQKQPQRRKREQRERLDTSGGEPAELIVPHRDLGLLRGLLIALGEESKPSHSLFSRP